MTPGRKTAETGAELAAGGPTGPVGGTTEGGSSGSGGSATAPLPEPKEGDPSQKKEDKPATDYTRGRMRIPLSIDLKGVKEFALSACISLMNARMMTADPALHASVSPVGSRGQRGTIGVGYARPPRQTSRKRRKNTKEGAGETLGSGGSADAPGGAPESGGSAFALRRATSMDEARALTAKYDGKIAKGDNIQYKNQKKYEDFYPAGAKVLKQLCDLEPPFPSHHITDIFHWCKDRPIPGKEGLTIASFFRWSDTMLVSPLSQGNARWYVPAREDPTFNEARKGARPWEIQTLCHGCCWEKFYLTCATGRIPGGHPAVDPTPNEASGGSSGVYCMPEQRQERCWYYATYKPINNSGVLWRVMLKITTTQEFITRPKQGNPERCVRPEGIRIEGAWFEACEAKTIAASSWFSPIWRPDFEWNVEDHQPDVPQRSNPEPDGGILEAISKRELFGSRAARPGAPDTATESGGSTAALGAEGNTEAAYEQASRTARSSAASSDRGSTEGAGGHGSGGSAPAPGASGEPIDSGSDSEEVLIPPPDQGVTEMAALDEDKVEEIQEEVLAIARSGGNLNEDEIRKIMDMVPGLVQAALVEEAEKQAQMRVDDPEYTADEHRDEAEAVSVEIETEARRRSLTFLDENADLFPSSTADQGGSGGSAPAPDLQDDIFGGGSASPDDLASETETMFTSECSPTGIGATIRPFAIPESTIALGGPGDADRVMTPSNPAMDLVTGDVAGEGSGGSAPAPPS